jgi:hypothetical protein
MEDSNSVVLLNTNNAKITLNKTKGYFNITVLANEYNEEGYNEFLEYFKQAWVYISTENLIFYLFVEIEGKEIRVENIDPYQ